MVAEEAEEAVEVCVRARPLGAGTGAPGARCLAYDLESRQVGAPAACSFPLRSIKGSPFGLDSLFHSFPGRPRSSVTLLP